MLQSHTVGETLERYITANPGLEFTPLGEILVPAATRRKQLRRAGTLARKGREDLTNLELARGVKRLQEALRLRERHFHLLGQDPGERQRQAQILGDLALGHFLAGDEDKAREALLQALVMFPKLRFDSKRFPPQMKSIFGEARFLADDLKTGNLAVDSTPGGAEIYANGNFVGFSPLPVRGMAAGRNLVTAVKPGYRTRTRAVKIESGPGAAQLSVELEALPGSPAAVLQNALKEARDRGAGEALQEAAARLKRDLLILARARGRDDIVAVQLYAYDARHKMVRARARANVSALDPDPACREVVATLMSNMARHPLVAAGSESREVDQPWYRRFRRSPWFWPVIGVTAAAVVAGTTVGIYYATRDTGPDPRETLVILPVTTPVSW
jgi:hypothetical protein